MAQRIAVASAGLAALSILHFIVHVIHRGHVVHALFHVLASLLLPALGYHALRRKSTAMLWSFHIGNVQIAVIHIAIGVLVLNMVLELEGADPRALCDTRMRGDPRLPPAPPPGRHGPPPLVPTLPPAGDAWAACMEAVSNEQAHAPGLLAWWILASVPLWGLTLYAAYQAHEYRFRLRVRGLSARVGEGGRATVVEGGESHLRSHAVADDAE